MSIGGRPFSHQPERYHELISSFIRELRPRNQRPIQSIASRRHFHDYFVTYLPSSSLHPDSRSTTGLAHKFPRQESVPHTPAGKEKTPAAHPSIARDTTVVRIPLKSAKHHFGASVSRGSRPYNEDSHQAGVIELPAFAKKPPKSVKFGTSHTGEGVGGESASGDPQVFYFGVFDGHGGAECSDFLRERLHTYLEKCSEEFHLSSSLQTSGKDAEPATQDAEATKAGEETLKSIETSNAESTAPSSGAGRASGQLSNPPHPGEPPLIQHASRHTVQNLEKDLVSNWKQLVGGYFRRFKPAYFSIYSGYQSTGEQSPSMKASGKELSSGVGIEEVLTYSFLKADYDFVSAQASKENESADHARADRPLNDGEVLGAPGKLAEHIGGQNSFKGGSTCSVAMVSTPTPIPFWHPATSSSMLVAHVGDTRILVCSTANGTAIPLTTNHHPSSPIESNRLRRYAATFVTDSFGEERISGLANTRAFGDIASKRIGVSAEPEIKRIELGAAEYSFMVLMSDGVSGTLSDQEVVDIVKEAKTPEQAARDVVKFATEVSQEGDNATCLVVRMGGWERRQEGGHGSLGTKESREFKRQDASDPRSRRR